MRTTFIIPGKAQAKQRPKITKFGSFTPKPTANYETYIKLLYTQNGLPKFDGPISLTVDVFMAVPESDSKKKKKMKLDNKILPTKKPDLDNIIKSIKDALNKVAWLDDSYVVNLSASKRYSETEQVIVTIEEVAV